MAGATGAVLSLAKFIAKGTVEWRADSKTLAQLRVCGQSVAETIAALQ
jgi:hypothetical protein